MGREKNLLIRILVRLFILSLFIMPISAVGVQPPSDAGGGTAAERNGGLLDSAWPMFHHDAKHTGQSPYAPTGNWRIEKWKVKMTWGITVSSPAIDKNGTLYIGSNNEGYLYAIYPNGTIKWLVDIGSTVSSPAIGNDGTIYTGSMRGYLYAIMPNGTEKWKTDIGATYSSPVIGTGGIIYIGDTDNGYLHAIAPNGTTIWKYQTNAWIYSSSAIGDDGTIYIGSNDRFLYAINPNGTLQWKFSTGDYVQSAPSIDTNGNIYFGSWDGYLYSLNPNGTLRWKHYVGTTEVTPAIALDGTIYIGDLDYCRLYSFTPNGTLNWYFEAQGHIYSSPSIDANGAIYFGSYNHDLYALNKNGTLRWTFHVADEGIKSSPVIVEDGTIYISGEFPPSGSIPPYSFLYALGSINDTRPTLPSIVGNQTGHVRRTYTYTITATDPDNNTLSYYIDWGDGTTTNWTSPTPSGQSIIQSHTWHKRGTYTIKVKARDQYLWETDWANLTVKMPYQPPQFPLIHWFLNRFPNAFPLLHRIFDQ